MITHPTAAAASCARPWPPSRPGRLATPAPPSSPASLDNARWGDAGGREAALGQASGGDCRGTTTGPAGAGRRFRDAERRALRPASDGRLGRSLVLAVLAHLAPAWWIR